MSSIETPPPADLPNVPDLPGAPDTAAAAPVVKSGISWVSLVIAALFGLVYAYLVWLAIGNAINFPAYFKAVGHEASVPWLLFVAGMFAPILVYVVAFVVTLRRSVLSKVVVFTVGLAASAALGYTVIGLIYYVLAQLPVAS